MKKKLNEAGIVNELKGSSLYFQAKKNLEQDRQAEVKAQRSEKLNNVNEKSSERPTNQSTGQSTTSSTNLLVDKSGILGRPKAFYISDKQDKDLDIAVDKLTRKVEGRVNQKIDRSTIIRLLLETNRITTDEMIDKLASQLIGRLISQLTS